MEIFCSHMSNSFDYIIGWSQRLAHAIWALISQIIALKSVKRIDLMSNYYRLDDVGNLVIVIQIQSLELF